MEERAIQSEQLFHKESWVAFLQAFSVIFQFENTLVADTVNSKYHRKKTLWCQSLILYSSKSMNTKRILIITLTTILLTMKIATATTTTITAATANTTKALMTEIATPRAITTTSTTKKQYEKKNQELIKSGSCQIAN